MMLWTQRHLGSQVTGAVGWRKDNLRYKKNEVFLDIVEQVCLADLTW